MTTTTNVPRTAAGARYHQLGDGAHAVVLDASGAEASERHAGHAWIAVSPGRSHLLFMDESGGGTSRFAVTTRIASARVGVFVDEELVHETVFGGSMWPGDTLTVDWSPMYDAML